MKQQAMVPHQMRVVQEKQELDTKIEALIKFTTTSDIFANLPETDKQHLTDQLSTMHGYSAILGLRINRF